MPPRPRARAPAGRQERPAVARLEPRQLVEQAVRHRGVEAERLRLATDQHRGQRPGQACQPIEDDVRPRRDPRRVGASAAARAAPDCRAGDAELAGPRSARTGRPSGLGAATILARPPLRSCTHSAAIDGRRPTVRIRSGQGGSSFAERSGSRCSRPGRKRGLPKHLFRLGEDLPRLVGPARRPAPAPARCRRACRRRAARPGRGARGLGAGETMASA